jgi:ABC-type polysaccharide/polyol phosphate transport system ATPase subunit
MRAFSSATAYHLDILILDEVLTVGYINYIEKARLRLHEMIDTVNILLMVSHKMNPISKLTNRVIRIEFVQIYKSEDSVFAIHALKKFMSNGNL